MTFNKLPRYYQLQASGTNPAIYFYICIIDLPTSRDIDKTLPTLSSSSRGDADYIWQGEFQDDPGEWATTLLDYVPPKGPSDVLTKVKVTDSKPVTHSDPTPPKTSTLFGGLGSETSMDAVEPNYKCRTLVFSNTSVHDDYFLVVMVNIPNSPAQFLDLALDQSDPTALIATPQSATSGNVSNPAFGIFHVAAGQTHPKTVNVNGQAAGSNTGRFSYDNAIDL